ncbi:MAG: acyltransferase [Eubacteriales bacterium]|nr:acyltransferase [Eubacteriales bacterium]
MNVIYSLLRITKERIKGGKIVTSGKKIFLSPKTEISIRGNGRLELGKNFSTQRGVLLGVRQDAVLHIGNGVGINRNTCIVAREKIWIGDNVIIAPGVCIYDHDHSHEDPDKYITAPIVIKNGTWIAANSVILKGVTIGENCTIAAGSVVTKDVPDNSVFYQKRESTIIKRK